MLGVTVRWFKWLQYALAKGLHCTVDTLPVDVTILGVLYIKY